RDERCAAVQRKISVPKQGERTEGDSNRKADQSSVHADHFLSPAARFAWGSSSMSASASRATFFAPAAGLTAKASAGTSDRHSLTRRVYCGAPAPDLLVIT